MLSVSSTCALEFAFFFGQTSARAPARSLGDQELVQAVLKRDRKATAEFVQLFAGRVHHYIRSRLAPRGELVDDLVHETFLAAWQGVSAFRAGPALESWILGTPRRKIQNHYPDPATRPGTWANETRQDPDRPAVMH